jgi:hypothetical protein
VSSTDEKLIDAQVDLEHVFGERSRSEGECYDGREG